jgi:hypothetical protein
MLKYTSIEFCNATIIWEHLDVLILALKWLFT